ncbi:kinesin, putative [Bodo saltans]|uniref:Kinesin-like protein n=1 Tax=Bodo saltans TaxID=75058 RepID=A0A0S4JBJ4_BODSA|nr:kinesin, putative [Bodo saltans]|eukprot:CUG86264.1 kinesin, putative [Bodo saltans]
MCSVLVAATPLSHNHRQPLASFTTLPTYLLGCLGLVLLHVSCILVSLFLFAMQYFCCSVREKEMSIEVHVRVRPGVENSVWATAETVIHNVTNSKSRFVFSKVHPTTCTNTSLFRGVEPLVHRALEGSHVTVMAYGQTGSGKTHSMLGTPDDEGIVPRAVKLLLQQSVPGRDAIALSVTEIYNDTVRDLLDPYCKELTLKDGVGDMVTTDATMVPIQALSDFTRYSSQALGNRKTGVTNMNEHSSRSHMILTLEVRRGNRAVSTMSLVDLAGSESSSRANTKGVQLQEGGHINQSLLSLGNVVNAIVEGRSHIPYRESKLTRLLRHSLGGHGLTCIVCCVNPARDNQDQTNTSLQFAQRAMKIKTDPVVQVTMPPLFMHQYVEGSMLLQEDIEVLCRVAYQRGLCDAFHSSVETAGAILTQSTSHTALALHALANCQRLLLASDQIAGAEQIDALEQEYVRLKDAVASLQASRSAETKRARENEVELESRRAKVSRLEREFDARTQEMDCELANWEYELSAARQAAVSEVDVLLAEESATRAM